MGGRRRWIERIGGGEAEGGRRRGRGKGGGERKKVGKALLKEIEKVRERESEPETRLGPTF